jgi:hypothetical protein
MSDETAVRLTAEEAFAAVLADHVRGDWSDRTYSCQGCRQRFEEGSQERWEAMTTDAERYAHRAELNRYMKPDWSLADYNAHVAEHLVTAAGRMLAPIETLAAEWADDLDRRGIRNADARYCWTTALNELRAALAQATATTEPTTHERGLRFRVETACDGYAGLMETDVPAEWEPESYIAGAAAAAGAIRGVLEVGA